MAKTSGGVRGRNSASSFQNDASTMFASIASGNGRRYDYSAYQTKRLQTLQKLGRSYNPREQQQAIQNYIEYANRVTGGNYRSINHASLSGARSELIDTANRANAYRNLQKITEELRRRKRR